ncbi:MAG: hypothetical protein KC503_30510 [Myxococcales bacterium]|nr:hypothetical protein [Myxococcales bacterium]
MSDYEKNSMLRLITWLYLLFVALLFVVTLVGFIAHTGFDYKTIVEAYLGKQGPFGGTPPRSLRVMLEITHPHIFAYGVLLFMLSHLLFFVPMRRSIKATLVVVVFFSALLEEGSGWLVRFVHPVFAYLKIASFVVFQLSLAVLLVTLARALMRGGALGHMSQAPGVHKK